MTLGVVCEVIFSTPATSTISFSPAATLDTAWKKADPLDAQAASKRVARNPGNPHRSGDVRSQMILPHKRRPGEVAQIKSLHL